MRFIALFCALMAWSAKADAQVIDDNFRLSEVSNVNVSLTDDATGACWTNLKEVREYAEEKLRMKGVNVLEMNRGLAAFDYLKTYNFQIWVNAGRTFTDGSGACIGYIQVLLFTFAQVNNTTHVAIAATNISRAGHLENFNQYIIEKVSELISELK